MVQERAVSLRPGASQPTKSLHTSTCTTRRPLRLRRLTSTVGSILRVTTRPRSLQIVAASPVRDFSSSDACLAKHSTCRGACHARQIKLVDTARPELPQGLGDGELVAGIDLGTTNSCIAISKSDGVEVVPNPEGRQTVPSVVAWLEDGDILVGEAARRQAKRNPRYTFYSVKRFIGRDFEEATVDAKQVAYEIVSDEDGQAVVACSLISEGCLYPEEVSAHVLAQLLRMAEEAGGEQIRRAVISVPAYFNESQREATVTAGRIAGLETIKLIKEPVAAALAYQVDVAEDQTVIVLDLGGGTFDVSILEVGGGVVEVLSTGGDPHLGGDDWDSVIIDWLASKYLSPNGIKWRDPVTLSNLKAVAEAAKVKLSTEKQVALRTPFRDREGQPIVAKLSRAEFDRLSDPLFKRLRLPLDACCWQAGVDLDSVRQELSAGERRPSAKQPERRAAIAPKRRPPVSRVLLVGGATRMPAFRRFVQNMTGVAPDEALLDPDLAVAVGAAVHAGSLDQGSGVLSRLETMDPLRRALLEAFAKKELMGDEELAKERLGDEYEAFMKQQRRADREWEEEVVEEEEEDAREQ